MKTCVVVADRSCARLFVTRPAAQDQGGTQQGLELREVASLSTPEGGPRGLDLSSNTRGGSNRSPHDGQFEFDEHQQRHRYEEERRFAKRIVVALRTRVLAERPKRLVLAIEPRLLGLLRQSLEDNLQSSVERIELATDLSWHSPRQIQETLAHCGALSPMGRFDRLRDGLAQAYRAAKEAVSNGRGMIKAHLLRVKIPPHESRP